MDLLKKKILEEGIKADEILYSPLIRAKDTALHISEITDKYIRHPSEVLKVGQVVKVTVKDVDIKKNRIALTMRKKNK